MGILRTRILGPGKAGSAERMQALYAQPTLVEDLRRAVDERLDTLVPAGQRGAQRVNDAVRYASSLRRPRL